MTHIEAFEALINPRHRYNHRHLMVKCFELDNFHKKAILAIMGATQRKIDEIKEQPYDKELLTQIKAMVTIRKCNSYTFETAEEFVLNLPKN
jgi:hypothetical protein